jgi:hypothetical protein
MWERLQPRLSDSIAMWERHFAQVSCIAISACTRIVQSTAVWKSPRLQNIRSVSRLPDAPRVARFLQDHDPLAIAIALNTFRLGTWNSKETTMVMPMQVRIEQDPEGLSQRFESRLRVIAKQSVTVWFNRDRLDRLLAQYIGVLEGCELLYAIDEGGRQVSSNIHASSINRDAYGQDLSRRPYTVSLSVLKNAAFHGAFWCDPYVSQVTRRECITVMYGVTSGESLLGFIAADFYPAADPS